MCVTLCMCYCVYTLCIRTPTKRDTLARFWHTETWVVLNIKVDSIYTQYVKADIYLVRLEGYFGALETNKKPTTCQDRKKNTK